MPTIKERLTPEARTVAEALADAEVVIKAETANEVWELIRCIRQHPEIAGPLPIRGIEDDRDPNLRLFAHFVGHCRRVVDLTVASRTIDRTFTETMADALKDELDGTGGVEVHHA